MRCEICGAATRINWGNAYAVRCDRCWNVKEAPEGEGAKNSSRESIRTLEGDAAIQTPSAVVTAPKHFRVLLVFLLIGPGTGGLIFSGLGGVHDPWAILLTVLYSYFFTLSAVIGNPLGLYLLGIILIASIIYAYTMRMIIALGRSRLQFLEIYGYPLSMVVGSIASIASWMMNAFFYGQLTAFTTLGEGSTLILATAGTNGALLGFIVCLTYRRGH